MAEEGYVKVLCRLNKVLHKLKYCSAELSEIESAVIDLEPAAYGNEMEAIQEMPDLLIIAGILLDTMNSLKAGLERIRDVQRVQVPVLRLTSLEEDNNMRSRPSPVLGSSNPADANKGSGSGKVMEIGVVSASYTDNFSIETRVAKRTAAARNGPQVCRHICIHHPEMIDPGLWSNLSEDLVGLVFARLPVSRIVELKNSSSAWSSLSDSSSFKESFAEANPNLFGLLGWDNNLETFWTRMFDAKSKEWHGVKLNFPLDHGYMDSWYACDGGLVCFVPESEDEEDAGPLPVYICNPLTNVWKALPYLPLSKKEPQLLQLVTDVNTNSYRVFLVYRKKQKEFVLGVDVYDSQTGSWGTSDSGLVFGSGDTLLGERLDPLVFDCATKSIYNLIYRPPLEDLEMDCVRHSILKDRLFVLHAPVEVSTRVHTSEMFVISEYEYQSSTKELRKLNDYEGTLRGLRIGSYVGRHDMELFTSAGFILSTWDNLDENGSVSQLIRLYDMAADEWQNLPTLVGNPVTRNERLEGVFMCELRWDAVP